LHVAPTGELPVCPQFPHQFPQFPKPTPGDTFRGYATYFKHAYHERSGVIFANDAPRPPLTHP